MNFLLKKIVPPPLAQSLRRLPILCWAADRLRLTTGGSSVVSDEEYRRRLGAHLATRGKLYSAPEPGVGFSVLTTVYEGTHADYFLETARSPLTSPFAGLHKTDPGYYAQALKARPCSGVNPLFFLATPASCERPWPACPRLPPWPDWAPGWERWRRKRAGAWRSRH